MKKQLFILSIATLLSVGVAQASCESTQQAIKDKIVNNGVPESNFVLQVVPSAEASSVPGQIVGNCEGESYQIVYQRVDKGEASVGESAEQPAPAAAESDAAPAEVIETEEVKVVE